MVRSRFLLFIFLSIAMVGCDEETPVPPYEPKEMDWLVRWSYTPGNNLTSSYSINTWGWDDIFTTQATYNFETILDGPAQTPNRPIEYDPTGANPLRFYNSALGYLNDYLQAYNIQIDPQGKRTLDMSILIGTNNIDPGSDTKLGITLWRELYNN